MWYEYAVGKEKINFMFGGDFLLDDLELIAFSFEISRLHLVFSSRKIPKKYPRKWDSDNFNSLIINITLSDIIYFESKGFNVMFTSTPTIEIKKEYSTIDINNPKLHLYCKSNYLTINEIKPYIDERWD